MEAVMDTDVVPLEGALEVEMDTNSPQAPPKLRGLTPTSPPTSCSYVPTENLGMDGFAARQGAPGEACASTKSRSKCAGNASPCNAPCARKVESTHGAT